MSPGERMDEIGETDWDEAWVDFAAELSVLDTSPVSQARGSLFGVGFEAVAGIRDYARNIEAFYDTIPPGGLEYLCQHAGIPFAFRHFGLIVSFRSPARLAVYDHERRLAPAVKGLIRRFGPVILENAVSATPDTIDPQRNIFPHLDFHVDRGRNQPNQYSLYSRDPEDPDQRHPRGTSTLFVANIVGHLQAIREGAIGNDETGSKALYKIFQKAGAAEKALGKVILNHSWSAPEGVGELVVIDNRTVLHASYHRPRKGWSIGTRYLY